MEFPILKDLVNKELLNKAISEIKARFADKDSVSTISNNLSTHTDNDDIHVTAADKQKWDDNCEVKPYIRVKSCTKGSSKIFRLTIDDDGILSGIEEESSAE